MTLPQAPMNPIPPEQHPTYDKGAPMSVSGRIRLNPATPLGYAELLIRTRIGLARRRFIGGPRDRGASVVEWVVISALVIGIAIAVAAILTTKLSDAANNLDVTGGGTGAGAGNG